MASILPAKRKPQKSSGGETLTLENLKELGHQLLSSRAHINNIPILLSFVSPSSPLDLALESLISLQSFFVPVLPEIQSPPKPADKKIKDSELVYQAWIRSKFDEFVSSLITIAISPLSEESLRDVALDSVMDFVKIGKGGRFQSATYHRLLNCLVRATSSVDHLLDLLVPKYFKYMDVRYFTYTSVGKIAKTCSLADNSDTTNASLHNDGKLSEFRAEVDINILYNVLSRVPPLELADKETSYEMWSPSGLSSKEAKNGDAKPKNSKISSNNVPLTGQISKKLKSKFTRAWISFLRLPLPLDVYKEVLVTLHQNVIPYMANPVILCDFLTRSYDIGGVISVMALSGLFILMTQYGLEYPNFYLKLYALLTPAVFMAKHRAMFFQLLDTCLKSSYLPAYLAAAFAKKLSRLSLSVQPSGAMIIIAVIHNLLRRHPSINFLVHQEVNEVDQDASVGEDEISEDAKEPHGLVLHSKKISFDPFNNEESDPAKSDAMRSSLWEIDTLRHHYCPAVSRFVESLENDLTIRAKTSEVTVADFSSGSYATIFGDEVRRRIKQVPLAFYKATPTLLFSESDFPGWTFGDVQNDKQDSVEQNSGIKGIENEDHEHVKRQCIERP